MQQPNSKDFNKGDDFESDLSKSPKGTDSFEESSPKVDNFAPPPSTQQPKPTSTGNEFEMPSGDELGAKPKDEEEESLKVAGPPPPSTPKTFEEKEPSPPPVKPAQPQEPTPPPTQGPPPKPEQKIDFPPEKKGHGCLWGVIIVIIILLLLAGAIFVNEMGILNLGLEKFYGKIRLEVLWGGLGDDGKKALADSASKMKNKSFNLNGEADTTLSIEGKTTQISMLSSEVKGVATIDAKGISAEIQDKGIEAKSKIKIKGKVENLNKFELTFSTDVGTENTLLLNLLGGESMIDLTFLREGNDIYIQNAALKKIVGADKEWLKIKTGEATTEVTTKAVQLADIISSGERTGWQKVNGVSCYVYEIKINNTALANYIKNNQPNLAWATKNGTISSLKFYLGKKDHLIRKIEASTTSTPSIITLKNKVVVNLENIGAGSSVIIPIPEEVAEMSWNDVKNYFLGGATTTPITKTPEERDLKRKDDLKKIQDALVKYKTDNGNYPTTNGAIEKTKDETSNLKNALVPKYLASLPVDPETDKYYYGYKSDDGTRCEIWSILENKNDPQGEDMQGFWIYKLKGN